MSAANVQRAGAAYEVVLIDKVSARVNAIVAGLDRLKQAFREIKTPAGNLNREMAGIAQSMQTTSNAVNQAAKKTGMSVRRHLMRTAAMFNTAAQSIGQSLIHIGHQMRNAGALMTASAVGMGAALFKATRAFASAQEVLGAFNATFRETAKEMNGYVGEFSRAAGRSTKATREALIGFRGMFGKFPMAARQINQLSKEFHQLGLDFAAWADLSDDEAINRIQAGLAGSPEVLRRWGIDLFESAIKARAGLMGINGELDETQKRMIRIEILRQEFERLGVPGSRQREFYNFNNQLKVMQARFEELVKTVGRLAVGPLKDLVRLLGGLADAAKAIPARTISQVFGAIAVLGTAGPILTALGLAFSTLGIAVIAAGTVMGSFIAALSLSPVVAAIAALSGAITGLFVSAGIRSFPFTKALRQLVGILGLIGDLVEDTFSDLAAAVERKDWDNVWEIITIRGKEAFDILADYVRGLFYDVAQEIGKELENAFQKITTRAVVGGGPSWITKAFAARREAAAASQRTEERLSDVAGAMRDLIRQQRGIGFGAAIPRPSEESDLEKIDLSAALGGAIGDVVGEIQAASAGGFSAAFANNISAFAPVMGPVESNQEEQIKLQQRQLKESEKANRTLKTIADQEWKFD